MVSTQPNEIKSFQKFRTTLQHQADLRAVCAGPAIGEGLLGGEYARTSCHRSEPVRLVLGGRRRAYSDDVIPQPQRQEAVKPCTQIVEKPIGWFLADLSTAI
jgi:hypothetical protein